MLELGAAFVFTILAAAVAVGVAVGVIPTLILTRRALRAMCSNFWGGLLSNLKFTPSIAHVHVHVCKHTTALYCL